MRKQLLSIRVNNYFRHIFEFETDSQALISFYKYLND
jgi:plasmid maintenance system killer protein